MFDQPPARGRGVCRNRGEDTQDFPFHLPDGVISKKFDFNNSNYGTVKGALRYEVVNWISFLRFFHTTLGSDQV